MNIWLTGLYLKHLRFQLSAGEQDMPMESRGPKVFVRDSLEFSKEVSASVAWYKCLPNF